MKKSSLKNYIAFLEAAAAANATDHWMRQHDLKDDELLKAKDEIAELKRRLLEVSPTHQHNHTFERNHNGTQA
jgi:hypothetical protein